MDEVDSASGGRRSLKLIPLILIFGCVYAVAYCFWYAGTPMGAHPVLDGKENLQLAWSIADGALPNEPFYRAPLYPLVISLGMGLGLPEPMWPDFARFINLAAWLISIWLVARLAQALWGNERAGVLASAIWAVYPVGLFFLGDPLDITLSIALLLAGLDRAVAFLKTATAQSALATGFLLALASLTRPQMWTVAMVVPLALAVLAFAFRQRAEVASPVKGKSAAKPPPRWPAVFTLVGLAIPALMMGAFNRKVSGEFVIMPTQGPFNMWAANKPGAHGKYFAQTIEVYQHDEHTNPARVESLHHYRMDRGPEATFDWRDVNDYWRERTRAMVLEDPLGFLGRLASKGYYLLNDYEQYNNKTYSVHRSLSPWLQFNFLGWGLLLMAAAPLIFWGRKNPLILTVLMSGIVAYAGGLILTYVSARFRLPLAPILAIIAGGWVMLPWRGVKPGWLITGGAALVLSAGVAFSNLFDVRQPPTEVQDYLLLGYAALDAQSDEEALGWAETALESDPNRMAAKELKVVARFNLDLEHLIETGERPSGAALEMRSAEAELLGAYSPRALYIAGVYAWWSGDAVSAQADWRSLLIRSDSVAQSALTALIMTGDATNQVQQALYRLPENARSALLQVALASRREAALSVDGQSLLQQLKLIYDAPQG
ncbi:hypothetical protein [Cerasicoccus frondis]|uniref:hypothetical protein n=1 Tax=Cerasicoccus frondis TaxID=490090 RepID=UPI002852A2A3|nr:hypothetical protein [Cerasicoccus frondis]